MLSLEIKFDNISTINQLLKIVHQIYQDINDGKDTCMVFFDVSKAFDKVWHEGLTFKIKQMGITGCLFEWLISYISERYQKVVLNGMVSLAVCLNGLKVIYLSGIRKLSLMAWNHIYVS